MSKAIGKKLAVVLAMALLLTGFASVLPVNAASKADMKKANVKWDLKNGKTLKFKTKWTGIGTKTHTVKMTNYKVKKAKKKGYKQCTFTLTFNRKVSPTDSQIEEMAMLTEEMEMDGMKTDNGPFGGGFYYTVVDYKTGKCLEGKNSKHVKVTNDGWKYSKTVRKISKDGMWIEYAQKATVKVKIVYPKKYKNLAIGAGGYTMAPHYYTFISEGSSSEADGSGVGTASAGGGIKVVDCSKFWKGKKAFSKETNLYSKKDKSYAHFKRVK